jgi:hypothetical protein
MLEPEPPMPLPLPMLALMLILMLPACAAVTAGTTQTVAVQTTPKSGAACELSNDKGAWWIPATPGEATVAKAAGDLEVRCRTADGWSGHARLASDTAALAFGNIVIGGIIGAAVDLTTGAAFLYPPGLEMMLTPDAPK